MLPKVDASPPTVLLVFFFLCYFSVSIVIKRSGVFCPVTDTICTTIMQNYCQIVEAC